MEITPVATVHSKPHILVVEDQGIIALDIGCRLDSLGYVLAGIAPSGDKAIELAASVKPDLVLMDILIDGAFDGIQTAHVIKETLQIPVVYLTAYADGPTLERAKATNPDGYIVKPFTTAEIQIAVELSLHRHQAEVEEQKAAAQRFETEHCRDNEARLRLSNQLIHDLQEPLHTVRLASELLASNAGHPARDAEQDYLRWISDGCASMHVMVESLMVVQRSGTAVEAAQVIDSGKPLATALSNLRASILDAGAEIICAEMPAVCAPPSALLRIFQNLIGNALKFRASQPLVIHIEAQRRRHFWQFTVSDNGTGFSSDQHDRLFAPSQRGFSSHIDGHGMGLDICRQMVEQSGGRIWAESEPGAGARFSFTIPAALSRSEFTPSADISRN